jgi:CheY-like chemotaxis protein
MATVLVINDDDDILDTYESMLLSLGYEPVAKKIVSSGPETVRDVGAEALLVDLQRPDDDEYGIRLIEELRADRELRDFPIILCSGAPEAVQSLRPRLDALGVPVVLKPFTMDELEETLASALRASGNDSAAAGNDASA